LQRTFLVFFDFDKASITPEADRVIRQAAQTAKQANVPLIIATGHADRAGSDKYNQALSERRARAVRDILVSEGLSQNQIQVSGKGESQPLVPTADGVREPQNRRVEIVLQ
jgi:outer membrane protein OmpA-like peptidoglycan-associated protein